MHTSYLGRLQQQDGLLHRVTSLGVHALEFWNDVHLCQTDQVWQAKAICSLNQGKTIRSSQASCFPRVDVLNQSVESVAVYARERNLINKEVSFFSDSMFLFIYLFISLIWLRNFLK